MSTGDTANSPVKTSDVSVKRVTGWRMALLCIGEVALVIVAYEVLAHSLVRDSSPLVAWSVRSALMVAAGLVVAWFIGNLQKRRRTAEKKLAETMAELKNALAQVRQLKQLLSICASCRRVRDDDGNWYDLEEYISEQLDTKFTHGLCDACIQKHYPDMWDEIRKKRAADQLSRAK